jgi:HAE1 family hydrophobic/amphiphilic exporter-1
MGYEWTAMSYQEKQVGSEALMVFALAIVLVFLVLAAQYESWANPVAVILVVPLAVLGTVAALVMRGFDNNVYTQIGIVLLIGLASKNAILIVEFALTEREKGKGIIEAAMDAAKLRFRPILMTAISSIAGFMPLVVAAGAGAASRQAIGTAVVGGMIAATVMSLIFTPVFYVVMQRLSGSRKKKSEKEPEVKGLTGDPAVREGT